MATMTIRVSDSKHARLRKIAEQQGLSLNKLFEEWSNIAIAQFDAEARFLIKGSRGNPAHAIGLLDKIERSFAKKKRK